MITTLQPPPADSPILKGASHKRDKGNHKGLSRRTFLKYSGLTAAVAALTPEFIGRQGWLEAAVLPPELVADTINGLVAFIVPGPDAYSVHQDVSTSEPGGIDANTTAALIFGLNQVGLAPPPFDTLSELVAYILNNVALAVNPAPIGPFVAPFANLKFPEKVSAFYAMESGLAGAEVIPLAGVLPVLTAFTAYSEAGVFDPFTRTLVATPVGWTISNYGGVSDGHDDLKGYFQNRKKVDG
jgi:peptidoglycan hydrolase-like protein with peptidoglycan-binding domain